MPAQVKRQKLERVEKLHPLGVKPSGNILVEVENPTAHRLETLGMFGVLDDELLMAILEDLDPKSLLTLSHTNKAFYAYCHFDELWKRILYRQSKIPQWLGSWRRTALEMTKEAHVSAHGKVYSDFLHRPFELAQIDYSNYIDLSCKGSIPRYSEQHVKAEFDQGLYRTPFVTKLEKPIAAWTLENLVEDFGDEIFRQEYMDWPLKVYREYCKANMDETPLYLFDCKSRAHKSLKFSDPLPDLWKNRDLFTLFGADRPDHQWLIIGPEKSGSTFHKDPNATSAWNSVISGHKYWIMFPQNEPPPGVWTNCDQSEVTAPESVAEWFVSGFYKQAKGSTGFCDAITGPGEVMYVPSGWWHAVVNLDECIAMTGNFVVEPLLTKVALFLKDKPDQISGFEIEDVYRKFMQVLQESHPDVYERLQGQLANRKKSWKVVASTESSFAFGF